MSEIVNDLKLSNLEISEESGIRLTSQNPTIKHTRDNNTSATLSISSDGILSLTGTTVSVNGDITLENTLTLSDVLIGSIETGLTGGTTAAPFPISTKTSITTLNVSEQNKNLLLANATTPGQVKIITATQFTTDCEITVSFDTPVISGQKILFDAKGDSATVLYTTQGWVILSLNGATAV